MDLFSPFKVKEILIPKYKIELLTTLDIVFGTF
jgi:hypothetical protein